jgi:hypothetical protein
MHPGEAGAWGDESVVLPTVEPGGAKEVTDMVMSLYLSSSHLC